MGWLSKLFGTSYTPEGRLTSFDIERASEKWRWVEDQLQESRPNSLKLAIIEADNTIDQILKVLFPSQASMAERLKLARTKFSNRQAYEDLWYAHKIRNLIAHEVSYDLPSFEAKSILGKFRRALEELGVL